MRNFEIWYLGEYFAGFAALKIEFRHWFSVAMGYKHTFCTSELVFWLAVDEWWLKKLSLRSQIDIVSIIICINHCCLTVVSIVISLCNLWILLHRELILDRIIESSFYVIQSLGVVSYLLFHRIKLFYLLWHKNMLPPPLAYLSFLANLLIYSSEYVL